MTSETPDLYIDLRGKQVVTYRGLLHLAHQRGLLSIETALVQTPSKDNAETAIVSSRVTMMVDGGEHAFTGIGDANPKNVGRNIAPHAIRMAETRAKARALRDAVNIGVVSVDELIGGKVSEYSAEAEQPGQHRDPVAELAAAKDTLARKVADAARGVPDALPVGKWILRVASDLYGEPVTRLESPEQCAAVEEAIGLYTVESAERIGR